MAPRAASTLTAARFAFLERMSPAGRAALGSLAARRLAPGERVLERGDPADGAVLVVAGRLRVYYVTESGREATLYTVEPGGTCVLALSATLQREAYPAWVESGGGGAAMVMVPAALFRRLVDEEPAFRGFVLAALSGRVFELMRALEEIGSSLIEQRVARLLLRRRDEDDCVRASQAAIAAELGTAREVVFRAVRALSRRGLVATTGRGRIRLLDARRLAHVAATRPSARARGRAR